MNHYCAFIEKISSSKFAMIVLNLWKKNIGKRLVTTAYVSFPCVNHQAHSTTPDVIKFPGLSFLEVSVLKNKNKKRGHKCNNNLISQT